MGRKMGRAGVPFFTPVVILHVENPKESTTITTKLTEVNSSKVTLSKSDIKY